MNATATKTRTMRFTGDNALVIHQTDEYGNVKADCYFLRRENSCWIFSKHDLTKYSVELHGGSCTCPGHRHHGHKGTVCKHRAAVKKLIALGKLKV